MKEEEEEMEGGEIRRGAVRTGLCGERNLGRLAKLARSQGRRSLSLRAGL